MMKRKVTIIVSASGVFAAMALILGIISLQGCGRSGKMIALASQDPDVKAFFSNDACRITSFRKEMLLPVSGGKNLAQDEDFIEVWWDDIKAGWVYYLYEGPYISRSGYQQTGHQFILSPGPRVELKSIDETKTSFTIIDGKEFK
jgi:hypothetical protein